MVQILRDLGHEILTVQEAGRRGLGDAQVLTDATADGRAVLTHNHRHYQRLHKQQPHAGIISCTRDEDDMPALAQRIHDAVAVVLDLTNRFVRVIKPNPAGKP